MSLDRFVTHNVITKNSSWEITIPDEQRTKKSELSNVQDQMEKSPSKQVDVPSKESLILSNGDEKKEYMPSNQVDVLSKGGIVLSNDSLTVLAFCKEYRSLKDISALLDRKNLHRLRKILIDPLLKKGYLERKYPESPRSPQQKYKTTVSGLEFVE
jgi:hypothetical protein